MQRISFVSPSQPLKKETERNLGRQPPAYGINIHETEPVCFIRGSLLFHRHLCTERQNDTQPHYIEKWTKSLLLKPCLLTRPKHKSCSGSWDICRSAARLVRGVKFSIISLSFRCSTGLRAIVSLKCTIRSMPCVADINYLSVCRKNRLCLYAWMHHYA